MKTKKSKFQKKIKFFQKIYDFLAYFSTNFA